METIIAWGILLMVAAGCSGPTPDQGTNKRLRMRPCPDRPNCVSSEAPSSKHSIQPFTIKGDPLSGWAQLRRIIGKTDRMAIIAATDRYLHAECKSRIFGFVDDLELRLDPDTGIVAIRSASRVGYADFGVNRRRVETLRHQLKSEDVIR